MNMIFELYFEYHVELTIRLIIICLSSHEAFLAVFSFILFYNEKAPFQNFLRNNVVSTQLNCN